MKRNWFFRYTLLLNMALGVISESYYTINAPGVIKSNRKYSVIVALHEANSSCLMRVGIEGPNFKEFKDVNLEPYETKLLEFMPERITTGDYKLTAEGLSGLIFKNESRLNNIIGHGPKIYIQTDKAVYKPEDVVNFRVLILDEHTRPLDIKDPVNVVISDSTGNRIKLYENISLTYGVYTGYFQLSKYPVLGTWNITVILGGRYEYSDFKTINIINYILPKFSVFLKTPTDIVLEDGNIRVVIYGKYVFNKYVEGNATVELWDDYARILLRSKQVDVNNLGVIEFNIKNEKDFENVYGLSVRASLTEKHTGRTETEKQDIYLHKQRYNLQIPYDEIEFENNKPYRLKVKISHWTGAPVLDRKSPVTMIHGNNSYEAFLNENGVATFEFEHDANANYIFEFKDTKLNFSNIFTSENLMLNNREFYCRLTLVDEKLKLGKPVLIEVSSIRDIPYLMYTVMGHASIIQTEHIKVPPNKKSHIINITPSIEMIPEYFIYVYYVHKGNLRYGEMRFTFPKEFENQISLSAPKQVKPGNEVTISISAQPKSYVSILAVDLGVYLLDKTYDLNKVDILNELIEERSYSPIAATVYPGIVTGLLTLTNANYPFKNHSGVSGSEAFRPFAYNFRQKFPETWIFDNFLINETNTELTLPIPDTITTWRLTAFSNNKLTGFGIVNGPTDITTIQSVFISINLPYSVKRGEIVTIPVTIFNYSNQTLEMDVVLHNFDQEFDFMETKMQGIQKSTDNRQQIKNIIVEQDKAETVNFLIYPLKAVELNLIVNAISKLSASYSDVVLQRLKVEPEGVPKQTSQSLYLSIPAGEKILSELRIEETANRVPDSDYISFSVGGHYLVPTVENFDELLQMPTGSGDQNMANFAPKVLILQYLKANDKLTKEKKLVENLLSSLEVSYQQQLSFRHDNGGYSIFGKATDEEPSTWLTAYVVRNFIKASQFVSIELNIIESALEYLASQQKSSGEFHYTGYFLNSPHKEIHGLTAFILLAFLENEQYASQYQKLIQNGIEFLNSNLNNITDVYALPLVATALTRAKQPSANSIINRLTSQVINKNGLKWWSLNDQNLASDIEITACSAIALLDTPGDHTSILKWLIEQRNNNGGFKSSSDTVVGLEALVKFSQIYRNVENVNLNISYSAKDLQGIEVANHKFHINSNNILDLQKHELPRTTRQVTFEITGNGASLVQLAHQFNIANVQESIYFDIQPKFIFNNTAEITLQICFNYKKDSESLDNISNMVIMETNLPSGFRFEEEIRMSLMKNKLIKKVELKNSETTIILYLDKLEANRSHCLELPADKTNEVLMLKPAAIKMYDYYNLSRSNTKFYGI